MATDIMKIYHEMFRQTDDHNEAYFEYKRWMVMHDLPNRKKAAFRREVSYSFNARILKIRNS